MKGKFKLSGGQVVSGGRLFPGTVLVEDGRIVGVEEYDVETPDFEDIHLRGQYVLPGFIDIHTHGAGGHDFMDCAADACIVIAREHSRHGTTLLFPTTLASDAGELFRFLEVYEKVKDQREGAAFGGLHLEGPYFSKEFAGAQDPRYLVNPDPEEYMRILQACPDIRRWSVAPELPGALQMGRTLADRGILPSVAHTSATFDDVIKAYDSGFRLITHFYSCMNSVTRRNSFRTAGCVEAGYLIDGMSLEVIGDGIHVPKELLQLILKVKGTEKVIMCTDSIRGAGMPDGSRCILGSLENGREVIIEDGVAKMPDRSCFAGSVATMDRVLRTLCFMVGLPLYEATRLVSENPARIMGYSDRKGRLAVGYDADIVICDKQLNVCQTYIMGKELFNAMIQE